MKKRRIVIISFVLAAVLAVGVGFAAVADTLLIDGTFNFRNANEILGNKDAAIRFLDNVEVNPAATATGPVSLTATASDDTATMNVAVNGVTITEPSTEYKAVAIFTVKYETTDHSLDPVHLTVQIDEPNVTGLDITVDEIYEDGATCLETGETMQIKVTVTYTPDQATNNTGLEIMESFEIRLVYDDGTTTNP